MAAPSIGCLSAGTANSTTPFHMVAVCQLRQPHSEGRAYFDRRVTQGKTKKEALRSLKRQISNAVFRHIVADDRRARH